VNDPQFVILAAGMGTRLGRLYPKPLTELADGRSIMRQQVENVRGVFGGDAPIMAVVGFKMDLVMEALPDITFAYNPDYDQTNTSKSLLTALRLSQPGGVVWMNGDVVFEPRILEKARPLIESGQSCVCVNTASVAEEEVKYAVDAQGYIRELSKTVSDGLGEAIGINFVSAAGKPTLVETLRDCHEQDYFERGVELAIAERGASFQPVDISEFRAVEVDFETDLQRANESG
jgi:CDP-glycerol glycerophosphotransferase